MVSGPSTLAQRFNEMSRSLGVSESDYMLLEIAGVHTHSAFCFRAPSSDALERFQGDEVHPYAAYRVDNPDSPGVTRPEWFMRRNVLDRRDVAEGRRSQDAQSLRQLCEVSKEFARPAELYTYVTRTYNMKMTGKTVLAM